MPFIIEEQFFGEEFRIFIAINGEYAVLHRERPFVIGNGKDTIETLVADESYRRTHPRTNSLCPILIDPVFLEKQELHFSSIPKSGKKVYVRNTSNVAKGGYSHNMTALVHPSIIAQATKILEIFRGLPYLGIDFMCNDITKEQIGNSYTIVEVNVNPGVAMHMLPGDNDAVNVANILVKLMFPEIFS
ncbi:MAG: hypothetical protein LBG52_04690 [Candidatus Peribacteria bacterium]|jgi:cyanophycin synthetase|nr:hypothetical protein [Candidatus Peribacteria bacterium]